MIDHDSHLLRVMAGEGHLNCADAGCEGPEVVVPSCLAPVPSESSSSPPAAARTGNGRCPPHNWTIESTDARRGNTTLNATCRLCGATRTYPKREHPPHSWEKRSGG